jgi:hypothetical protein
LSMSLLDIRDKFRGPAASIDEQIESFAFERVPANQRWPIPAISLVLSVNATAMSFLAMVIGPLLHVAITAATKGRYYEPAHASAKYGGDR